MRDGIGDEVADAFFAGLKSALPCKQFLAAGARGFFAGGEPTIHGALVSVVQNRDKTMTQCVPLEFKANCRGDTSTARHEQFKNARNTNVLYGSRLWT